MESNVVLLPVVVAALIVGVLFVTILSLALDQGHRMWRRRYPNVWFWRILYWTITPVLYPFALFFVRVYDPVMHRLRVRRRWAGSRLHQVRLLAGSTRRSVRGVERWSHEGVFSFLHRSA